MDFADTPVAKNITAAKDFKMQLSQCKLGRLQSQSSQGGVSSLLNRAFNLL